MRAIVNKHVEGNTESIVYTNYLSFSIPRFSIAFPNHAPNFLTPPKFALSIDCFCSLRNDEIGLHDFPFPNGPSPLPYPAGIVCIFWGIRISPAESNRLDRDVDTGPDCELWRECEVEFEAEAGPESEPCREEGVTGRGGWAEEEALLEEDWRERDGS